MSSFRQCIVDIFLINAFFQRQLTDFLKNHLWFVYVYLKGGNRKDVPVQDLYDLLEQRGHEKIHSKAVLYRMHEEETVTIANLRRGEPVASLNGLGSLILGEKEIDKGVISDGKIMEYKGILNYRIPE